MHCSAIALFPLREGNVWLAKSRGHRSRNCGAPSSFLPHASQLLRERGTAPSSPSPAAPPHACSWRFVCPRPGAVGEGAGGFEQISAGCADNAGKGPAGLRFPGLILAADVALPLGTPLSRGRARGLRQKTGQEPGGGGGLRRTPLGVLGPPLSPDPSLGSRSLLSPCPPALRASALALLPGHVPEPCGPSGFPCSCPPCSSVGPCTFPRVHESVLSPAPRVHASARRVSLAPVPAPRVHVSECPSRPAGAAPRVHVPGKGRGRARRRERAG